MKQCPFCAEDIRKEAIKCRYCGEWLQVGDNGFDQLSELINKEVKCKYCGEWLEVSGKSGTHIIDVSRDGLLKARDNFEKRLILKALKKADWNQSEAARILKIHRNTLIQKMKSLGIDEDLQNSLKYR